MTKTPVYIFRPATPGDEAFLLRLYASTRVDEMTATRWPAARQETFLRGQFTARQSDYRARFPQAVPTIVLLGRTAIGALIVNRADDEIRLVDLALLPEHRGAGTGGRLLRELQDEAQRARKPLRLQVLKNNPAVQLYTRLGFGPAGENGLYLKMEWRADGA